MFRVLLSRGCAAAALVLVSSLSACGSGGNADTCAQIVKLYQDYTTQAQSAAGEAASMNKLNADLGAKVKDLAGQSEGDLATALNGMAETFTNAQIDPDDQDAALAKLAEVRTSMKAALDKVNAICT
ncbi:hypothetical protein [Nonomuraea jiangxiensis]|uniref:Small secreted protein n=1 Tax=Nonomuraea jiangxiensis TaxID=633440 RepID=A0A1G8M7J9_9ACTN|nr:hypothetical protein [Nonomuraea jiangxiensis]SDI63823.1 hypothetical protein SAMN05421869_106326 [Nonomuraea jiangxiensis]